MRPYGTNCAIRIADGRTHIDFASSGGPHSITMQGDYTPLFRTSRFREGLIDFVRSVDGDTEDMRREMAERFDG